MNPKPFQWMRGAKEIERDFLGLTLSDGWRRCDGCGARVRQGETVEEQHVYIINSKGAKEWANFFLCGGCSVRVYEMAKGLPEGGRRTGRAASPTETTAAHDTTEINDEWNILKWSLYRARDRLSGEATPEAPQPSTGEYEAQVGVATAKVQDAIAELEKLSVGPMTKVPKPRKK